MSPPVAPAAPIAAPAAAAVSPDVPGLPAPASLPDIGLDPATLRDPHAAFRRRSSRGVIAAVAAVVVVMGVVIYATSGEDEKATTAPKAQTDSAKPTIGVSLAPYRSDAHETLPVTPPPASDKPARNDDTADRPAVDSGSGDFADRFKAASGRE